jgi:hypothetical protein
MNNARFLYNLLFDEATLSTVPPDNEKPGWPVENLQNTIHAEAWKTNGTGNVTLRADLGKAQAINAIGLAYHNFHPATVVTFRAYSDEFTTEVYSEELEIVGAIIGWLEGGWLSDGWLGYPIDGNLILFPRVTSLLPLAEMVGARYIALEFANGGGEENEFYLGRAFVGQMFEPDRNFSHGFSIEPIDDSNSERSLGGVLFTDEGEQYLRMTLSFNYIQESQAFSEFWQFARYMGTRKDFVAQAMDSNTRIARLTTMVGKFQRNPALTGRAHDRYAIQFVIREMI